jgi:hypothetical protein
VVWRQVRNKRLFYNIVFYHKTLNFSSRNPVIAPFDEQFFLVLNVAVGGTGGYFPGKPNVRWLAQF